MANMEHCRFSNTLADLLDCEDHLEDPGYNPRCETEEDFEPHPRELSKSETRARNGLIDVCKRIARQFADDED